MPSNRHPRARSARRPLVQAATVFAVGSLVLTGCSSSGKSADAQNAAANGLTTVTLALDYFPNAEHNGLAYAMQEGLFKKQGIQVKIVPFASTAAETLVAAGKADIGFSGNIGSAELTFASGTAAKAIFTLVPRQQAVVAVMASSGITRPAQLAGKTYGGYGTPAEAIMINQMIKDDGGTGTSKQVTLSIGSAQALAAKQVDAAGLYPDDLYQDQQEGKKVTSWNPSDYGIPDSGGLQVIATDSWLKANPKVARGFVAALAEGEKVAIDSPTVADAALEKQFSGINAALTDYVATYYAKNLLSNPDGPLGTLNVKTWQAYADWMIKNGLMVDSAGKKVTSFEAASFVTNEYLPTP